MTTRLIDIDFNFIKMGDNTMYNQRYAGCMTDTGCGDGVCVCVCVCVCEY